MQSLWVMEFAFLSYIFASCFPSTFDKKGIGNKLLVFWIRRRKWGYCQSSPPFKTAVCMRVQTSSATKTWTSDWRRKPFCTVNSSCQFAANLSTVSTKLYPVTEIRQFYNRNEVQACNFQRFFELSRSGGWICKRSQGRPLVFKT
jgi:hypothetical protein